METDHVKQLSHALVQEDLRGSDHPAVRRQILMVIKNVISAGQDRCCAAQLDLYHTLLQLVAIEDDVKLSAEAKEVNDKQFPIVCGAFFKDVYHLDCTDT